MNEQGSRDGDVPPGVLVACGSSAPQGVLQLNAGWVSPSDDFGSPLRIDDETGPRLKCVSVRASRPVPIAGRG